MTEKKYTHKIVMFDVNSAKRVAFFTREEMAVKFYNEIFCEYHKPIDDFGTMFNIDNIVQINPVEVIRCISTNV